MARRTGKRAGRPSKCTPAVVNAIVEAIEVGADYADAAAVAGISHSTLSNWRNAGKAIYERIQAEGDIELTDEEQRLLDFWKRFAAAESRGAVNAATVVYNAALKDPDFALKWLERRRPESWRVRQWVQQEVTGRDEGPIVITVVPSPPDNAGE